MKRILVLCCFTFLSLSSVAQVGIGNTNPNAQLDISASNTGSPLNTDGILIPRVSNLTIPSAMTLDQDGMMVFYTGNSFSGKGFYYWNHSTTSWTPIHSSDDDWTVVGTDIERQNGDVYIGNTSGTNNDLYISNRIIDWDNVNYIMDPAGDTRMNEIQFDNGTTTDPSVRFTDDDTGFFSPINSSVAYSANGTEAFRFHSSGDISVGLTSDTNYKIGINSLSNLSQIRMGNNDINFPVMSISHNGDRNNGLNVDIISGFILQTKSSIATSYTLGNIQTNLSTFEAGTFNLYGLKTSIGTNSTGIEYGVHSSVTTDNGFAGYFIGRSSFGNTTANRYILPAQDGTANQVMATDGAGQVNFVDANTLINNSSNYAVAKIRLATGQSLGFNTKVNFNTIVFDTNNNFSTTDTRFNVSEDGIYRISAQYTILNESISSSSSPREYGISIYVNGAKISSVRYDQVPPSSSTNIRLVRSISTLANLSNGDYIEIFSDGNEGVFISTNDPILSYFEIERIK
ncbi:hypothetical protein [Psychroserpens sp. MEBiC05023]